MEQSVEQAKHIISSNSCNRDTENGSDFDNGNSNENENSISNENEQDKKLFWVPDEEVTNCPSCNVSFNVRVRKHHCRACGNVFCSNCSDNKIKISEYLYAEKVRVCDRCFLERSTSHSLLLQEDLGARKQINQDLKKALTEKMIIVEKFKTFLLEFDSEILNNTNYKIPHILIDTTYSNSNNCTFNDNANCKFVKYENNGGNNETDKQFNVERNKAASTNTTTTITTASTVVTSATTESSNFLTSFVKGNEMTGDHKDIIELLKKSERGLKLLNERIKNYNITIEKQKDELKQLKIEKEQKEELTKLLKLRNVEMQQKNQNICNLLMEKNNLVVLKEEHENLLNTYKKQIQQLIKRCNTLEMQMKQNMNKKKYKKWKLKDHVKNYESTKTSSSTRDTVSYWDSFQKPNNDIHMTYTIAQGIDEETENDNCCSRCQRRMCHFM